MLPWFCDIKEKVVQSVPKEKNATEPKLPLKMLSDTSRFPHCDVIFMCTTLCSDSKDAEVLEQQKLTGKRNKEIV